MLNRKIMRTNSIGAIQIVERFINKEYVIIGTIEMTGINEWWWTCCIKGKEGFGEKPYGEGCATSRRDSIYEVRNEYREQLQYFKRKSHEQRFRNNNEKG